MRGFITHWVTAVGVSGILCAAPMNAAADSSAEDKTWRRIALPSDQIHTITGTDPLGYPLAIPDRREILTLIHAREFQQLEEVLAGYQRAFEADFTKEMWINTAMGTFACTNADMRAPLDAWVEAMPASAFAAWARGAYYASLGWQARGPRWSAETLPEQFEGMDRLHTLAVSDLLRALELNVNLVHPYGSLFGIHVGSVGVPGRSSTRDLLDEALDRCLRCYYPRASYAPFLAPRWGGSYAEMEAFAREAEDLVSLNPRLRLIRIHEHFDRAGAVFDEAADAPDEAAIALNPDAQHLRDLFSRPKGVRETPEEMTLRAIEFYTRALALGELSYLYTARAYAYLELKRNPEALADMQRALEIWPQDSDALMLRAWYLNEIGSRDAAQRDAQLAVELAPGDTEALWTLATVTSKPGSLRGASGTLKQLVEREPHNYELRHSYAIALYNEGRPGEALPQWKQVLQDEPNYAMAHYGLGLAYEDQGRLKEALVEYRTATRLDPTNTYARHRVDYLTIELQPPFWLLMSRRVGLLLLAVGILIGMRRRRKHSVLDTREMAEDSGNHAIP